MIILLIIPILQRYKIASFIGVLQPIFAQTSTMRFFLVCDDESFKGLFNDHNLPVYVLPGQAEPNEEDVLFDLRDEAWDLSLYKRFKGPVFINAVVGTLSEHNAPANVVRMNGWPGMLEKPTVEAAASSEIRAHAEEVLSLIGKKTEWVADIPGLVSPRVIAMIINEACLAIDEQVSSRDSIDIAMKLGTNYPKGPFEWANQVGWERISRLLNKFASEKYGRYQPARQFKGF
jgi:3-hydroxybutyryl-CoA dehydrogenase